MIVRFGSYPETDATNPKRFNMMPYFSRPYKVHGWNDQPPSHSCRVGSRSRGGCLCQRQVLAFRDMALAGEGGQVASALLRSDEAPNRFPLRFSAVSSSSLDKKLIVISSLVPLSEQESCLFHVLNSTVKQYLFLNSTDKFQ